MSSHAFPVAEPGALAGRGRAFAALDTQPADPLLTLIAAHAADPRPEKIDLGVGVYRDDRGATPVLAAVKAAEARLLTGQTTKAYLGAEGDLDFVDALRATAFGPSGDRLLGLQTPGGTGALRLAAELASAASPGARVFLGAPSWPIHAGIFQRAGLRIRPYRYFAPATQDIRLDSLLETISEAGPGDLVLLHGACHNPTGADLTAEAWNAVGRGLASTGAVPLVDLAYQGLGQGWGEDAEGVRTLLDHCETIFIAYSCDKNFGLYRERTGALFYGAGAHLGAIRSNLLMLARCNWSMPPDHGAAVVREILADPRLRSAWSDELSRARRRLRDVRQDLAARTGLNAIATQNGLFSLLPVTTDQVGELQREHAVYMAATGRANLAGLNAGSLPRFAAALDAVRHKGRA